MRRDGSWRPHWTWWVRSGERVQLGIDPRLVFRAPSALRQSGLVRVEQGIGSGRTIVEALRSAGLVLPAEGWSILESSEQTGRLGEAMIHVGELLRDRQQARRELAGQLWYPVLVLLVGILVMGIILVWVVPEMQAMSESAGSGDLPWLTRHIGMLYGSAFLGSLLLGFLLWILFLGWKRLSRYSLIWAERRERLTGIIPGFGRWKRHRREALSLNQLGLLVKAGVTVPAALSHMAESEPDRWVRAQFEDFRRALTMGLGFEQALGKCRLVDPEGVPLLLAGQESGRLEVYLARIAEERAEQCRWQLAQAIRLLEPALLLFLSLAIGGLIFSYLFPMIRLLEQLA